SGADLPDVVWVVRDLDALEVRTGVERVVRLPEVDVPDRRIGLCARLGAEQRELRRAGLPTRVDRCDVRVQAAVRLVVDDINVAGVAGNHPRHDRGVIRLLRQVDA